MSRSSEGSARDACSRSPAGEGILYPVQALRAFAAFLVCLAHTLLETNVFHDHATLYAYGKTAPLPAGVDLFFLISGFIMLYTSRQLFSRRSAPRTFLIRRLTRIVPLYWLFTILVIVATWLFPERLNKTVFDLWWAARSFLFIPTIGPDGDVGPILALGWSLEYEMYFYALFAVALMRRENSGLLIVTALLGGIWTLANLFMPRTIGVVIFLANPIVFEFVLGIAFARCWLDTKGTGRVVMYACWLIGTFFVYLLLKSLVDHRLVQWGLPCLFLFVVTMGMAELFGSRWYRPFHILGDASYALYLSHPFTLECVKWAMVRLTPNADALVYVVVGLVISHLAGIVIHRLVERPMLAAVRVRIAWRRRSADSAQLLPGQKETVFSAAVPGQEAAPFEGRHHIVEAR